MRIPLAIAYVDRCFVGHLVADIDIFPGSQRDFTFISYFQAVSADDRKVIPF